MSRYASAQTAPPIEAFFLTKLCNLDAFPEKVNLGQGTYRTDEGKPWVLPVVREAEKRLAADESQNHEYLAISGFEPFTKAATALLLGDDSPAIKDGKVVAAQCLSGTGSLRVGADFLFKIAGCRSVLVSKPTWGNHNLIFKHAGFTEIKPYRYWDAATRSIDFAGMIEDLKAAAPNTVVVLHGCAHNPTGCDPTKEQWTELCKVIKEKGLVALLDTAYQGFASGDPAQDAWAVRHFVNEGLEVLVAQSFAKNFGLYNERAGNLVLTVSDPAVIPAIKSQIDGIIRGNWSNPPNHGAKVVHMVLTNPELKAQWLEHIKEMSSRIILMRSQLRQKLEALGTPGNWEHITQQIGMFSFTGLNEKQVAVLVDKYHIYLLKSGRINMCGLTTKNVDYVAKAIDDAVRNG